MFCTSKPPPIGLTLRQKNPKKEVKSKPKGNTRQREEDKIGDVSSSYRTEQDKFAAVRSLSRDEIKKTRYADISFPSRAQNGRYADISGLSRVDEDKFADISLPTRGAKSRLMGNLRREESFAGITLSMGYLEGEEVQEEVMMAGGGGRGVGRYNSGKSGSGALRTSGRKGEVGRGMRGVEKEGSGRGGTGGGREEEERERGNGFASTQRQPFSGRPDFSDELRMGGGWEEEVERRSKLEAMMEEEKGKNKEKKKTKRQPLSRRPDFSEALKRVEEEAIAESFMERGEEGERVEGSGTFPSVSTFESGKESLVGRNGGGKGEVSGERKRKEERGNSGVKSSISLRREVEEGEGGGRSAERTQGFSGLDLGLGKSSQLEVDEREGFKNEKVGGEISDDGFLRAYLKGSSEEIIGAEFEKLVKEEIGIIDPLINSAKFNIAEKPDYGRNMNLGSWDSEGNVWEQQISSLSVSISDEVEGEKLNSVIKEMDNGVYWALKEGRIADARQLVEDILVLGGFPSKDNFCKLTAKLSSSGNFSAAYKLFSEADRIFEASGKTILDERTFGVMIKNALRDNRSQEAVKLLSATLAQGLRPRVATWSAVVASLGRCRETSIQALDLFDRMCAETASERSPMSPDCGAFNAAMNAAVTAGRLEHAEALLKEGMPSMGVKPDYLSFNILVKGYGMEGQPDKMRDTLDLMKSLHVSPDVTTYNTLVAAYIGTGNLRAAENLVKEMKKEGGLLMPQVRTLTILMKGYLDAGKLNQARALLFEMQSKFNCTPNEVSFTTLINAYTTAGQMENAQSLLVQMAKLGIPANIVTYNIILHGFCRLNRTTEANSLMETMEKSGIVPTPMTYHILIDECIKNDDNVSALGWFQQMRQKRLKPTVQMYTNLMKAFGNSGQPNLSKKIFEEMEREEREGKIRVDAAAWSALIHSYSRGGQMEEAHREFQRMKASGVKPTISVYGTLVKGYAKTGKAPEVLVLWKEIKERVEESKQILKSRQKFGQRWVRDGQDDIFVPDEALLDDLVRVCVKAGYFQRALEIVHEMEEGGIPADRLKYKRLFIELYSDIRGNRRSKIVGQEEDRNGDSISVPRRKSQGFEAFKFWLGLPNNYYQGDWTWKGK